MLSEFVEIILKVAVVVGVPLGMIPLIVHLERRGAAFIQKRVGPNRVGPLGLFQPLADVVKFMFKEEVIPSHVHKLLYILAPMITLVMAILPFAGIPVCEPFLFNSSKIYPEIFRSDLGVLYVFLATSLGAYGILIAGWASNNKYTLLGSLRACAQMVSYELSMSITLVALFVIYGTVDGHSIIQQQNGSFFGFIPRWGVFYQPIGCLIFLIGIFAESNRLPFDLAEGESELVAGYHLEYSSMKFALFFMAEYLHMIVLSALFIILFFGGYNLLPGFSFIVNEAPLSLYFFQFLSLLIKIAAMVWFFIWVRWSIPRFRYDQLMDLGWKKLLPLGIFNLVITVVYVYYRS